MTLLRGVSSSRVDVCYLCLKTSVQCRTGLSHDHDEWFCTEVKQIPLEALVAYDIESKNECENSTMSGSQINVGLSPTEKKLIGGLALRPEPLPS